MRRIEHPATIGLAPALDDAQGFVHAGVVLDVGSPEVVERTKHVVVVPGRERKQQERRTRDLAGRAPPEERALEQVILASPSGTRDLRNGPDGEARITCSSARSSGGPSSTQIVVWYDERRLFGASQFQPPSSSCSPTRRCARLPDGRPKYAPSASAPPLMHGSTSPSKNGFAPNDSSHRKPASRRAIADMTAGSLPSTPAARRSCIMKSVGNQSGSSARCHAPSAPWQARTSAPIPACGTRARSAAIVAADASVRSRIACQRMAGSESSSQSISPRISRCRRALLSMSYEHRTMPLSATSSVTPRHDLE